MDIHMIETEGLLPQAEAGLEAMKSRGSSVDAGISASELAGRQVFTQIFHASLVPFETAALMRKHFRIGHRCWTLIPPT